MKGVGIHHVVSMSGGKDSTATAILALETHPRDSLRFVFADTGNEEKTTYDYINYLEQALGITIDRLRRSFSVEIERKRKYVLEKWPGKGVPLHVCERAAEALVPCGIPFLDLALWKGRFPSRTKQFCTQFLKTEPLVDYALDIIDTTGGAVWSWQGTRIEESQSRRRRLGGTGACVKSFDVAGGGLFNYRPILRWKAADCFEAHHIYGIKPNPLYLQGMSRVGCMPCVNASKDEALEISKRFPEHIERIAAWERIVGEASKRRNATFFPSPGDNEDAYERGNVYQVVEWAKTSRGGKQYDFLRMDDPVACQSAFGLCE